MTDLRTIVGDTLARNMPVPEWTSPDEDRQSVQDATSAVFAALVGPEHRDALVAWLIEAGVLTHAESVTDDGGEGFVWIDDLVETSPTVDVGPRDWDQHLPHMVPVYRVRFTP